jgi:hypothetical protein
MRALRLLLALGVAVVLAPLHAEAKSRAYNASDVRVVLIYRAGGCAGVEYPLIGSCGKRSDYDTYVCAKKVLRPGKNASYNFNWGTTSTEVVAFWCDATNTRRSVVRNTGNSGDKSRCAATGALGNGFVFKCGYTKANYPPPSK